MITMALLIALGTSLQASGNPRVIIEAKNDVEVTHHDRSGTEVHGKLYLDDVRVRPFRILKGQRFQMVKIGQEGGTAGARTGYAPLGVGTVKPC